LGSRPIVASHRPNAVEATPRTRLPPEKLESAENAKIISAKYSAGPNRIAHPASRGAKSTSAKIETVPPTNDAMADIASAGPPRPAVVSAYPSRAVTTADAVPGTFSRIVLMELPYCDP
jgi:hypothetical protein